MGALCGASGADGPTVESIRRLNVDLRSGKFGGFGIGDSVIEFEKKWGTSDERSVGGKYASLQYHAYRLDVHVEDGRIYSMSVLFDRADGAPNELVESEVAACALPSQVEMKLGKPATTIVFDDAVTRYNYVRSGGRLQIEFYPRGGKGKGISLELLGVIIDASCG
jgi:hypothetical protein